MTTVVEVRVHHDIPRTGSRARLRRWWLWLSLPIALLGTTTSVCGITIERVYADETENWRAQAIGQDIANLGVLVALLVLAYAAARGSARALLAWAGTVVYTAYTFTIYAFAIHFGPLFLVYVAVLALSAWALIGFFADVDPARVREAFRPGRMVGFVSVFLMVLAGGFALLWIGQDVPAMVDGNPSAELRDTGLLTNPVHVLDLALFLPAGMLAGILLRRGRDWGHTLAPMVLTAMAGISLGIVVLTIVNLARDLDAAPVVAVVIGLFGSVQAATCWLFLRGMRAGATDVVHRRTAS
jgi:hypothetical protein